MNNWQELESRISSMRPSSHDVARSAEAAIVDRTLRRVLTAVKAFTNEPEIIDLGGGLPILKIDAGARQVYLDDQELTLTRKAHDLLDFLACNQGRVVARLQIMKTVWGTEFVGGDKTIDMHVSWVRRALGDDPRRPQVIKTIRGVGFRFEKTVQVVRVQ